MILIVVTFCSTFLLVLVVYWIMPYRKMKAVNKELKYLLQVLPISKIIEAFTKSKSDTARKPETPSPKSYQN